MSHNCHENDTTATGLKESEILPARMELHKFYNGPVAKKQRD
jgi:hypothetical protein